MEPCHQPGWVTSQCDWLAPPARLQRQLFCRPHGLNFLSLPHPDQTYRRSIAEGKGKEMPIVQPLENGLKAEEDEQGQQLLQDLDTDPVPASFAGRLDLSSFRYTLRNRKEAGNSEHENSKPQSMLSSSPGRSPRRSTLAAAASSASPSPSRRPPSRTQTQSPKRKLEAGESPLLTPSPSRSPLKKRRSPSGYAPPSTYAHLPLLPDVIAPDLLVLFVGLNPGIETARSGHAYAHPSNLFWKLLHSSGCTTRRCSPTEDRDLPRLFSMGNTNIVARPTRNGGELSKKEMDDSVNVLLGKVRTYKPECVCLVGKGIWESIWRVKRGRPIKKEEFKYGWQDEEEDFIQEGDVEEEETGDEEVQKKERKRLGMVFVATSTSGLAASLLPAEKERIWRELGVWVERRRAERAAAAAGDSVPNSSDAIRGESVEIKAENLES